MTSRLCCPFCEGYGVERLFLASAHVDSCECTECGARWDQDPLTGEFRGRGARDTVISPRDRA